MAYYSKYYVYTLAYPDGRIFYVGKGQGDRIHQHEKQARQYDDPELKSDAKIAVIREIWASGGQVAKTKVFETENEGEANEYEKQFIAQCDSSILTNRTKGGGPQFSKRDPYARLKHREYYYSPKEAFEKLGVSQEVWNRLSRSGVLHFYQAEGCTWPVLVRKEVDDFAERIKNGTYPIDAWEMPSPNMLKGKPAEKRSLWWDDEPPPQQAERQYPMSRLEMLNEATRVARNAAQHTFSMPCYLIGSYEREDHPSEQNEPAWDILLRVGLEQYTYTVKLQRNQFVIIDAPIKPLIQSKMEEGLPSANQTASENNESEQPGLSAVSQPPALKSVTSAGTQRLTITQVKEKWEYVLRRVKSKKDGARVAAILRGYDLMDVDDSADLPTVILKAKSLFHYHAIQKGGHQPFIEWALKIELEQECCVRLLSSEESLS